MAVQLTNLTAIRRVYVLDHEHFCADGACACTRGAVVERVRTPNGMDGTRVAKRRHPASLSLGPGESRILPTTAMSVPSVKRAVLSGVLRMTFAGVDPAAKE